MSFVILLFSHKHYSILFYSINVLQCQHWRSIATCAAALELSNLNYVHGELTFELKPKDKYHETEKGQSRKNPSNPRLWTAGKLMSSQGHTQLSTSWYIKLIIASLLTLTSYYDPITIPYSWFYQWDLKLLELCEQL